jgi:ABC-2 type transport system permease protein
MESMRLFWRLIRQSFRLQLTYRAANLAGLATNFFFGLLRAAVLTALYGARSSVEGLSLQDVVTFTGLSQAMIACLSFFGWYEVADSVYTGAIAADLLKPMSYFSYWLARDLGRAAASFLMRAVTMMLAYALVFDIAAPRTAGHWLLLGLSVLLSVVVSFCWSFLVNLGAFWTPDARGLIRLAFGASWFMSGFLMPLRLFPDWFVRICNLTPFPAMVNTVIEVYLGVLSGPALLWALLGQVFWIAVLAALAQLILRAGVRHLVIQGG